MIQSPQTIRVMQNGVTSDAELGWHYEAGAWRVELSSAALGSVTASAADAFEALCLVREEVEPLGWRLGVAGALPDVWPSGMSRDQGGGLTAYRMEAGRARGIVETFEQVDLLLVSTLAEQRANIDRSMG